MSPAYDLNPIPRDVKPPYLSMCIDEKDNAASFDLVLSTAGYYGLTQADFRPLVKEVVAAVCSWRKEAARLECSRKETERMASAFEHEAWAAAQAYSARV